MKYRKRPVVIEAAQWLGKDGELESFPWYQEATESGDIYVEALLVLRIKTLEGLMSAAIGDWIIQGIKGEIYPCKPDIFEATYEAVETERRK